MNETAPEEEGTPSGRAGARTFLVVVDETEEMELALRFACRRARHTGGRVALMAVMESSDFAHWMAIGDKFREEARSEAERLLQRAASRVYDLVGTMPILYVREGDRRDELFRLLEEEPNISILVLGAATGKRGPGPLVSALVGKHIGRLRVPLTIVPAGLDEEVIDNIS